MEVPAFPCSQCRNPLPAAAFNTGTKSFCPICGSELRLIVFPAAFKPVESGRAGDLILVEGEAGCFYHPEKKAVLPCDSCGRFLCSLCDVELNGEHLCPPCIESGKKKGKLQSLENHRVRYDDVALAMAILPLVFFGCVSPLVAPVTLYYVFRHWNSPRGILAKSKIKYVMAAVVATIEIVGGGVLGYLWVTEVWK